MKRKMKNMANSPALLILGLALVLAGLAFYSIMDATGTAARMSGFVTGMGGSLAAMWLAVRLYRRVVGRERFEEEARAQSDERGREINLRAAAVQNVCAVAGIVVMLLAATIRGDEIYMALGVCACVVVAVGGGIARAWYKSRM